MQRIVDKFEKRINEQYKHLLRLKKGGKKYNEILDAMTTNLATFKIICERYGLEYKLPYGNK